MGSKGQDSISNGSETASCQTYTNGCHLPDMHLEFWNDCIADNGGQQGRNKSSFIKSLLGTITTADKWRTAYAPAVIRNAHARCWHPDQKEGCCPSLARRPWPWSEDLDGTVLQL